MKNKISGNLIDVLQKKIYPAVVTVEDGIIKKIEETKGEMKGFIIPGLVDAHIHIESSMVTPGAFASTAVRHGTVATVSDPHEIANVLGMEGVMFMIRDGESVPFRFYFGAPSCVPATDFETSGARIDPPEIKRLMAMPSVKYLSEMMNFPGVIYGNTEVLEKLNIAKEAGKPVDGHAPGLSGESLEKYVGSGISTDHECSNIDEALEKISLGMKILIREGSAARNLDALKELYKTHPGQIMLCSDDLHPEMLLAGHINKLISRLVSEGYDLFDVIKSATVNPAEHYKLGTGLLRLGDPADLVIVDDPARMNVLETWIGGRKVYDGKDVLFSYEAGEKVNKFNSGKISAADIAIPNRGGKIRIMKAYEGELLTGEILHESGQNKYISSDTGADCLKIVVKNRYDDLPPVTGLINGFGLKEGAFASSVAHDSHNIICVGTNDGDIVNAVNEVIKLNGGLSVCSGDRLMSLQLDIGGIMSSRSCQETAARYLELTNIVRSFGCSMKAPFMTLSFMALLVIPDLKIGDKGLFDVRQFKIVPLFAG